MTCTTCVHGFLQRRRGRHQRAPAARPRPRGDDTLTRQVQCVLDPQVLLDFPAITEICERAVGNPEEVNMALSVLVATLGEQTLRRGDERSITLDYYKSLTILNEIVHDAYVRKLLQNDLDLPDVLRRLKLFAEGGLGEQTDEVIRMMAAELEKKVFQQEDVVEEPRSQVLMVQNGASGAAVGAFAQSTILAVTYANWGYTGMVGAVALLTGVSVPISAGFVVVSAACAIAGVVASRSLTWLNAGQGSNTCERREASIIVITWEGSGRSAFYPYIDRSHADLDFYSQSWYTLSRIMFASNQGVITEELCWAGPIDDYEAIRQAALALSNADEAFDRQQHSNSPR